MGLFKSSEQRAIERKMAVRRARLSLEKLIKSSRRDIEGYIRTAREARSVGNRGQVEIARRAVNKCIRQQKIAETQLINIKLAEQMQNQVQSHKQFAEAMRAVTKSVASSFKEVNMNELEKDLDATAVRADTLNERMEGFLESSAEAILGEDFEGADNGDILSEDEFEQMVSASGARESDEIGQKIRDKLSQVEQALNRKG